MVTLNINGKAITVPNNYTVLRAAESAGFTIPTLCDHPGLTPFGGCRLCVVEVKGARTPMASCTLPVQEGMEVTTESAALQHHRRTILELILSTVHSPELLEERLDNQFAHWVRQFQIDIPAVMAQAPRYSVDSDPNPFIRVDLNKCILCTRCIRACAEVQGRFVWGMAERGYNSHIVAGANTDLLTARCESCGACVAFCPTGALDNRLSYEHGQADRIVRTTCSYCGVGCQFDLNVKDYPDGHSEVIRVTSTPEAPVNGMALCVKGRYGYDYIHHPQRLKKPLVRRYLLEGKPRPVGRGEWVETDWDTALNLAASKLAGFRDTHGPQSVGVLSSAKCLNEENYLMNKFARQVMGTNSIDHCARLCHASTVAGLAVSYGSGAMSNSMDDVAKYAQSMLIIGSNTTEQHPVFGTMIRQAVLRRGMKLVVADPRKIEITEFAVLHLRQRPGTDIALVNGLMHIILKNGWEDKKFIEERTEGFEEFQALIEQYTPEVAAKITGVSESDLYKAAEILALNKPMAVVWAMGITQHTVGVRNVMTLANLQMLLGNIGIPGGGVNPLRGQNNVQGACDMGGLPNVYPGYQAVTAPAAKAKFEEAWGTPLDDKVGLTVTEMIPAAGEGKIKALYILGEDPVMSDPHSAHIRECLETCDFILLQEIFPSETSVYADILLPGVSFAEKTGTFTNTERRIQMVHQAIQPLGEARPDWQIIADLAQRILDVGERKVKTAPYSGWNYESTEQVMAEVAALTPSYAGVSHARLDRGDRLQWPVPDANHPGTPILHTAQFARGKGKFMAIEDVPPAELPDEEYPWLLSTGRVLYHWHGGELTRRTKGLMEIYSHPLIELNPEDAQRLGVNGSRRLRVSSRRGVIEADAWVTERVPPGIVFANFHFPEACANELTIMALDPVAKIPEYKVCAVKVELI